MKRAVHPRENMGFGQSAADYQACRYHLINHSMPIQAAVALARAAAAMSMLSRAAGSASR